MNSTVVEDPCVVCTEGKKKSTVLPCGHNEVCLNCLEYMFVIHGTEKCPMCRSLVTFVVFPDGASNSTQEVKRGYNERCMAHFNSTVQVMIIGIERQLLHRFVSIMTKAFGVTPGDETIYSATCSIGGKNIHLEICTVYDDEDWTKKLETCHPDVIVSVGKYETTAQGEEGNSAFRKLPVWFRNAHELTGFVEVELNNVNLSVKYFEWVSSSMRGKGTRIRSSSSGEADQKEYTHDFTEFFEMEKIFEGNFKDIIIPKNFSLVDQKDLKIVYELLFAIGSCVRQSRFGEHDPIERK